ncbi:helix-turn-helix domain-containing protein [Curtobacterium flaccumfaciens]|uniref:helix-turn-helix domain-containing protein n=1 Tax=Curtobacterium flaccumfaciens TaxID=2035 RepID=UPI002032EBD8|nr:helix-turn-helix transcriptional regulator [Curtobacterium flaccumfaciens]
MMGKKDFVRGNDRVERLLRQPDIADAVAALETEADDLDRVHAMSLAMVREAGKRTQAEIAHELGISQGAVSQMERREDMLLSTLRSYITATGAENPRIIVTVNGRDVDLAI